MCVWDGLWLTGLLYRDVFWFCIQCFQDLSHPWPEYSSYWAFYFFRYGRQCCMMYMWYLLKNDIFASMNSVLSYWLWTLTGCDISGFEDFAADSSGSPSDERVCVWDHAVLLSHLLWDETEWWVKQPRLLQSPWNIITNHIFLSE